MKKIIALLSLIVVVFVSCEGEPGRDGLDGQDGTNGFVGQVFDKVVNFGTQDNFKITIDFPSDIEVFESDTVLIYRLAEVVKDNQGEDTDVWQLLPQNFFLDQGILQYNYEHTFFDFSILLDGNFDLTTLDNKFTQEQVFRIAVIPSDFLNSKDIDITNIQSVLPAMQNVEDIFIE